MGGAVSALVDSEVWTEKRARVFLRELLHVAIGSANPKQVLAPHLPAKPTGKCVVVGAGKAAASMAQAVVNVHGIDPTALATARADSAQRGDSWLADAVEVMATDTHAAFADWKSR